MIRDRGRSHSAHVVIDLNESDPKPPSVRTHAKTENVAISISFRCRVKVVGKYVTLQAIESCFHDWDVAWALTHVTQKRSSNVVFFIFSVEIVERNMFAFVACMSRQPLTRSLCLKRRGLYLFVLFQIVTDVKTNKSFVF